MIMKMRDMMKRKNGQKGFTLVELIVVMAILAILAAIAVPKYSQVTENAKKSAIDANVRTIVSAVQLYQAANEGKLPTVEGDISAFLQKGLASMAGQPDGASYTLTNNGGVSGKVTISGWTSKYSTSAEITADAI